MSGDVVVCGSGPAGLEVATACAAAGLSTTVWSPTRSTSWHPTYGAWRDTVPAALVPALAATWPSVEVHVGHTIAVDRSYARFDTGALQERMSARAEAAGVRWVDVAATRLEQDATGTTVHGAGHRARASVVIDATGSGVHLDRRGTARRWQTAAGRLVDADGWVGPPRLMDFSADGDPPTFLYALPFADGRLFLEETSLLGDLPEAALRDRLDRRVRSMGLRVREVLTTETCRIPMDLPRPRRGRVVGFGAAAAMIHPSTGYLLFRVWDRAPRVARAIAAHLTDGPEAAAKAAWRAVWPASARATDHLHRAGARALGTLDAPATREFFAAFFGLPPAVRDRWLDDRLSVAGLASAMSTLFRRLPNAVRWRLVAPMMAREVA